MFIQKLFALISFLLLFTACGFIQTSQEELDHSDKSILARGCDPQMSAYASKILPPLIGNPEYIPTTNDDDFINKLISRKWSVVFFAPGACRYSATVMPIPGGNNDTKGWTLEEYKELVYKYQGKDIQIVEAIDESQSVDLLKSALVNSLPTK